MRVTGQHWTVAFLVALVAHAGLAAAVLWQPPPSGAQSAGLGGIEVSLGPAGGAPGDVAAAAPLPLVEPEAVQPPEPEQMERPEPTEVSEAVTPPAETPELVLETAEPPVPEPLVPEPVIPETVEPAKPVNAEPEPVAPLETAAVSEPEPEPEPKLVPEPEITPPPQPKPKPVAPAIKAAAPKAEPAPAPKAIELAALPEVRAATSVPSVAGVGGKAGTQDSPDAGSADQVTGGGLPGHAADYTALLQAWLHKHKEYPRRAQARRQEGTALLYFVMDRDGRVSDSRIEQSSGYRLLDDEVLALIHRAEPLPPPPPELTGDRIKLVVPVQFFLR